MERNCTGWIRKHSLRFVAVLAILPVVAGCGGGGIKRRIEKGIAEAMPAAIGPAKSYSVRVSGPTMALISGKLNSVDIVGEEVRTSRGVNVAKLNVSLKDLVVSTETREIKSCGSASYEATVSESELERYLTKAYSDIPDLNITLVKDRARVSASPKVAGVGVRIDAETKLAIREGSKLILDLTKVDVIGVPTPGFARNYIEKRINPVFDIADLGFDARLDWVRIDPGAVTLAGTLDLVKAIRKPKRDTSADQIGGGIRNL